MGQFSLGKFHLTSKAITALTQAAQPLEQLLARHENGDWGDSSAGETQDNEESLLQGRRLRSVYTLKTGVRVQVITNWNRTLTTILLDSEEY